MDGMGNQKCWICLLKPRNPIVLWRSKVWPVSTISTISLILLETLQCPCKKYKVRFCLNVGIFIQHANSDGAVNGPTASSGLKLRRNLRLRRFDSIVGKCWKCWCRDCRRSKWIFSIRCFHCFKISPPIWKKNTHVKLHMFQWNWFATTT